MAQAPRDQNFVASLLGTSNIDGSTPVVIWADPTTHGLFVSLVASSAVIGHVITDTGSVTNATLTAETTKVIGTVNQGTSPWLINVGSATGSAVPANAFLQGITGASGNLLAVQSANVAAGGTGAGIQAAGLMITDNTNWYKATVFNGSGDGLSSPIGLVAGAWLTLYNGSTWDRGRSGPYTSASTIPGVAQTNIIAQYNSSAPTITNANYTQLQADVNANLKITEATLIAGENQATNRLMVQQTNSYSHISTATTTTVKSGTGFLHAISVNSKGTVASTITVYDNTAGSGTIIGVIDSLNLFGIFIIDVSFSTGLTLVTTGTVAPDITVSFL